MHIRGLLAGGASLLLIGSVLAPTGLFPPGLLAVYLLLALRYRMVYWAHSEWDARASSLLSDLVMASVFALSVGQWTTGPVLIMAGYAANQLVILANGGAMPMLGLPDPQPCYVRIGPQTRLRWLADIFITEGGRPYRALFSIGDAVITVGLWVYATELFLMRWLQS